MKESEVLKEDLWTLYLVAIVLFLWTTLVLIMGLMFNPFIITINVLAVPLLIWQLVRIHYTAQKMRFWRWIESEDEEHLPKGLKQKYLLYEDALRLAKECRKDAARAEEHAELIKAEMEAEFGDKK